MFPAAHSNAAHRGNVPIVHAGLLEAPPLGFVRPPHQDVVRERRSTLPMTSRRYGRWHPRHARRSQPERGTLSVIRDCHDGGANANQVGRFGVPAAQLAAALITPFPLVGLREPFRAQRSPGAAPVAPPTCRQLRTPHAPLSGNCSLSRRARPNPLPLESCGAPSWVSPHFSPSRLRYCGVRAG